MYVCIPIIYFRSVVATERVEDGVGVVLPRLDTLREQLHLLLVREAVGPISSSSSQSSSSSSSSSQPSS